MTRLLAALFAATVTFGSGALAREHQGLYVVVSDGTEAGCFPARRPPAGCAEYDGEVDRQVDAEGRAPGGWKDRQRIWV